MSVPPQYDSRFAPGAMAPPPPPPPPARTRSMRAATLGVGAVAVIALAVIVALAITLPFAPKPGPRSQGRPADAALAFVNAVAAGEAGKALSLQVFQPADSTFLTDEALRASRQVAPISDIMVVTDTDHVTEVAYRLGAGTKRAVFKPVRQSDGTYKIERGTTTVQVTRRRGLPVHLDGIPLAHNEAEIFPGAHSVTAGQRFITYAESSFTAADATAFPRIAPAPRITEEGRVAFATAAKAALEACLQQKVLAPPDCPQNIVASPDARPDLNTLKWKLEGPDPVDSLQPRISAYDETVAEAPMTVKIAHSVVVTQGQATGTVTGNHEFRAVAVGQLTKEPLQVRLRR